jgi:hypothetical protein
MNPLIFALLTILGLALITQAVILVFFYLSTERFHRWMRSQRDPDPFLVEARVFFARLTSDSNRRRPGFIIDLELGNPGDIPIYIKSLRVKCEDPVIDVKTLIWKGDRTVSLRDVCTLRFDILIFKEEVELLYSKEHTTVDLFLEYFSGGPSRVVTFTKIDAFGEM